MSFRKGDKVEVMYRKEIPVSWCVGEILSGNDLTYRVKYDRYPGMCNNKMVETVSRKFVRPCPITVLGVESFSLGDIVEVFHDSSWKLASILKVLKKSNKYINGQKRHLKIQYVVRLLGCLEELLVDKAIIRARQMWHDGKWIQIGRKDSEGVKDGPSSKASISNHYQIAPSNNAWLSTTRQECPTNLMGESPMISSISTRRMLPYNSFAEDHGGGCQKKRTVQIYDRIISTPPHEKVLGKRKACNFTSDGYNRTKQSRGVLESSEAEPHHSESDECSVGSCSVTDQDEDTLSRFDRQYSYFGTSEDEVEGDIRRLELHAYRSTLEALYASGPLSWEQEAMLTNLRIVLRISNDQHSMELKHLIKSAVAVR